MSFALGRLLVGQIIVMLADILGYAGDGPLEGMVVDEEGR